MSLTALTLDNADQDCQSLADIVNGSSTAPDVVTRLGRTVKPVAKVIDEIAASISGTAGYEPPVAYANGLNIIRATQTVTSAGETYAPAAGTVPFVTGPVFDPAQWRLLIAKTLVSRAEMKALGVVADGIGLLLVDSLKSGSFRFTTANVKALCDADPGEGVYIKPTGGDGTTGAWVRLYEGALQYHWFAGIWDGVTNDGAAVVAVSTLATALVGANLTGYGTATPALQVPFLPNGVNMGATSQVLTQAVQVKGQGGGEFGGAASLFKVAADTHAFQLNAPNIDIDGIAVRGPWVFNSGSLAESDNAHAFKQHFKATTRNVFVQYMQGDAFSGHITAGSGGDTEGNANTNYHERFTSLDCRCGFNLSGADTNAGLYVLPHIESARWVGIKADDFLGSTWIAPDTAGCGVTGEPGLIPTCSFNNGFIFYAVVGHDMLGDNWCSANSPPGTATNNTGWRYWKAAGAATAYAPQWAAGQNWRAGGPFIDSRLNGQGLTINLYSEFDQPPVQSGQNTLHMGGQGLFDPLCRRVFANQNGVEIGPTAYVNGSFVHNFKDGNQRFLIDGSINGNTVDPQVVIKTGNLVNTITFQSAAGATDGDIQSSSSNYLTVNHKNAVILSANNAPIVYANPTEFSPWADNSFKCGTAATRWKEVFAAIGTINTSDERNKTQINAVSDAILDAWGDVHWSQFKFRDAVEAKGKDGARLHIGLVAQRVRDALAKRGIDGFALGLLCYDEWDDQFEPVNEEVEITHLEPRPNPDHSPAMHAWSEEKAAARKAKKKIPKRPDVPEMIAVEVKGTLRLPKLDEQGRHVMRLKTKAGNIFGIRYDEAQALESAFQRRRADRLENRLKVIEHKLGLTP